MPNIDNGNNSVHYHSNKFNSFRLYIRVNLGSRFKKLEIYLNQFI